MRIAELKIKNYKSFTDLQSIVFHTSHSLLVGKNNAGKSNILSALEILLGKKIQIILN
jgi:chromosome segregation ATPase